MKTYKKYLKESDEKFAILYVNNREKDWVAKDGEVMPFKSVKTFRKDIDDEHFLDKWYFNSKADALKALKTLEKQGTKGLEIVKGIKL